MINDASLAAVAAARWGAQFVQPQYDTYSFAQLPRLVRAALGLEAADGLRPALLGPLAATYDQVILCLVDGFGWRFFTQYADSQPFLRRVVRDGMVSQILSQFPSTTAAHVTTIHTGLPVGQSGVYEWFYYEPLLDAMIAPLLFSFAGDARRNTLRPMGIDPAALYPGRTLYQDLGERGVRSTVIQHQDYTPSPYSDVVFAGADVVSYRTLPEALATLGQRLEAATERAYYFLYFDAIDALGHKYGPDSPQFAAEAAMFWLTLEQVLQPLLAAQRRPTLLLLTADHGQVALDPARAIYVNQTLPALLPLLQTTAQGRILAPAGSCRDLFLHVQPDHLAEAQGLLADHLAGVAEVYPVADLIDQGFFGPVGPALRARVGNLVVLPYAGEAVWWYEAGRFAQTYRGSHGGLTPAEMETILLAQAYPG